MRTLTPGELSTLENAAERAGVDFRARYSGRGMEYGTLKSRTCVGVVGSLEGVLAFVYHVTRVDEVLAAGLTVGVASDNMGRYSLIYYWPGVSVDE